MKKVRDGSPGVNLPYAEVVKMLKKEVYSVGDLTELGLFKSVHFAREAINEKKLKATIIDTHTRVISKYDLLYYWMRHRNSKLESFQEVSIKLSGDEVDFLNHVVNAGKKESGACFSATDFLRNVLSYLRSLGMKRMNDDSFLKINP